MVTPLSFNPKNKTDLDGIRIFLFLYLRISNIVALIKLSILNKIPFFEDYLLMNLKFHNLLSNTHNLN